MRDVRCQSRRPPADSSRSTHNMPLEPTVIPRDGPGQTPGLFDRTFQSRVAVRVAYRVTMRHGSTRLAASEVELSSELDQTTGHDHLGHHPRRAVGAVAGVHGQHRVVVQDVVEIDHRADACGPGPEVARGAHIQLIHAIEIHRAWRHDVQRDGPARPRRQIASQRRQNHPVGRDVVREDRVTGDALERAADLEPRR